RVGPVVRWVERATRAPGEREWASGAALLVRRSDLEKVGLLDERYFMYTEDVDLCVQLRRRGRKILFVPQAEIRHLRGRSAARNPATERLRRRSQMAYYEKHHPLWLPLLRLYLALTGKTWRDEARDQERPRENGACRDEARKQEPPSEVGPYR
ncbi:MAG TPA: glycosyltransferase, partial [Vicinamibacterales bacterium]|nr:glycosyltransferase [Vicinamibacterales bacterium]